MPTVTITSAIITTVATATLAATQAAPAVVTLAALAAAAVASSTLALSAQCSSGRDHVAASAPPLPRPSCPRALGDHSAAPTATTRAQCEAAALWVTKLRLVLMGAVPSP